MARSLLAEFNKAFRASEKQKRRAALGDAYFKGPRPRPEREPVAVRSAPPLADPVGTLGHPPRGRKRR